MKTQNFSSFIPEENGVVGSPFECRHRVCLPVFHTKEEEQHGDPCGFWENIAKSMNYIPKPSEGINDSSWNELLEAFQHDRDQQKKLTDLLSTDYWFG